MIQLAPIDPLVQKTLKHKERAFNDKKTGNVLGSSNYLKNTGPVALSLRTTFVRMTSMVGKNTKTLTKLQGGEMVDGKLRGGLATTDSHENLNGTIYGPITDLNTEKTTANKYYRPMAGLKSIDVQFKGAVKALREGAISWTCWSFEDLERLTPYFLWHGKHILLEWGWNLIEGVTTKEIKPKLFNLDKIVEGNVDDLLVQHIRNQAGNYDAMLGVISNYEYTSRDDGGFDCNTKIIARGTNMFKNSVSGFSNKGVVRQKKLTTRSGTEVIKKEYIDEKVGFKAYIEDLRHQLKYVYDTHQKDLYDSVLGTRYGVLWDEDYNLGPYCTFGWLEDNILSRFFGRVSENKTLFELRSIEPKYIRETVGGESRIKDVEWSSVKIANHEFLKTVRPVKGTDTKGKNVLIIPGQWAFSEGYFPEEYKSETGAWNWLPFYEAKTVSEEFKAIIRLSQMVSEFEPFRGKDDALLKPPLSHHRGYIRNILLHYELIQDAFEEVSTIESGMSNLFNNMNYDYNRFWDFRLSKSEGGNRVKVIDGRITDTPARVYIGNNNSKNPNYNNEGMYIFPVWESTSIVKGQTFTAKLPDKMQYAAMYASNSDHSTDDTEAEGQEKDFSTTAAAGASEGQIFGRLYNPNYDGKLTIGHDLIAKKDTIPFKFNRNFGNLTTDPNLELSVENIRLVKKNTGRVELEHGVTQVSQERVKRKSDAEVGGHDMEIVSLRVKERAYEKKRREEAIAKAGEDAAANTGGNPGVSDDDNYQSLYDGTGMMRTKLKEDMLAMILDDEKGINNQIDPLINVELELEIDGTGGIFPGNVFHSSYLPKKIRDNTVYQALDVNHRVDSSFWSTTIRGQMRYAGAGDAVQKIEEVKSDEQRKIDKDKAAENSGTRTPSRAAMITAG